MAEYKVELLTIAIGPVHHSIDLVHCRSGKPCGKMAVNIKFTHIEMAKITLRECEAIIED